ncbi:ParB/RepB/Spo0J family partition protein [Alloscardovia omnicolens]|uniref:ParB/RepB/Spo0J family partition protein n=1 Tax=Alloscardovia omnicolens TaxID=419015 RepID=UPI00254A06FB|nr:ParB/RepB/Spo0J family partition protein [Alloscardovia omnicolens]MDK6327203.1 ParB/RepB/Spo0J family partition protein [Alloscardovia omnicolens]MDK8082042.1 ParB/RepB/Spo0J family partition protein [Alloscardovia omnicolens]
MAAGNPFEPASSSVHSRGKASIFSNPAQPDVSAHSVTQVDVDALRSFRDHPFKVVDDGPMAELMASIERDGIHSPVIVRPLDSQPGCFEVISGHRRVHAARKLGLVHVPALIMHVDDDQATIMMVDANLNRPSLLPSEKAKSMYQRYIAMKHQGVKHSHVPHTTADVLAKQFNTSEASIRRLAALGRLPDSILVLLDSKRVGERFARMLLALNDEQLTVFARYMTAHKDVKAKNTFIPVFMKMVDSHTSLNDELLDHVFHTHVQVPVFRLEIPVDWFGSAVSTPAEALERVRVALHEHKKTQE